MKRTTALQQVSAPSGELEAAVAPRVFPGGEGRGGAEWGRAGPPRGEERSGSARRGKSASALWGKGAVRVDGEGRTGPVSLELSIARDVVAGVRAEGDAKAGGVPGVAPVPAVWGSAGRTGGERAEGGRGTRDAARPEGTGPRLGRGDRGAGRLAAVPGRLRGGLRGGDQVRQPVRRQRGGEGVKAAAAALFAAAGAPGD